MEGEGIRCAFTASGEEGSYVLPAVGAATSMGGNGHHREDLKTKVYKRYRNGIQGLEKVVRIEARLGVLPEDARPHKDHYNIYTDFPEK